MGRWWLVVSLLAACGDNQKLAPDAAPDASPFGAPSDRYPAFGVGRPLIVGVGGPVMPTVRVVPIFYADEASGTQQLDFLHKLAASASWTTMTSEYGVGALTIDTPITLASNAPANQLDADLQALLTSGLDGTHPEYGAVDAATLASTIFLFHTPLTTTASGPGSTTPWNCNPVGGYHNNFSLPSGVQAVYAISYDCPPPSYLATTLDLTTSIITHELIEAATDPFVETNPAIRGANNPAVPFAWSLGSELGDMCEMATTDWFVPADVGYTIQRTWSNAEAIQFHDPCVPHVPSDGPFMASIPDGQDDVIAQDGSNIHMPGTIIPVGTSRTIDIDLSSSGPTDDWMVSVKEPLHTLESPTLQLELDRTAGQNGNIVHLTITALRKRATGVSSFWVLSQLGSQKNVWYGAVGVP